MRYLVQTRATGEPWKTTAAYHVERVAIAVARELAAVTYQLGGHTLKRHQYVRVTYGDRIVEHAPGRSLDGGAA